MKKKKIVGKGVRVFLVLALAGCLVLFLVNLYIIRKEENTDFNFKVFLDGVLFVYKKFKSITIL